MRFLRLVISYFILFFATALAASTNYHFLRLKTFAQTNQANPISHLLEASDGRLYGVTRLGGTNNGGNIYSVKKDGTDYRVLINFNHNSEYFYGATLIEDSEGTLFFSGDGRIIKLFKDGSGLQEIFRTTNFNTSLNPRIVAKPDGFLYGTTPTNIFRITKNGTGYESLHAFDAGLSAGGGLAENPSGELLGSAFYLSNRTQGFIFKISSNGSGFAPIFNFNSELSHAAGMTFSRDGNLFAYGQNGTGQPHIYKLNIESGIFTILHTFTGYNPGYDNNSINDPDGGVPRGFLSYSDIGVLYGTTVYGGTFGGGTIFQIDPDGSNYRIIKSFRGGTNDGAYPYNGVTLASDGLLYGSTLNGGDGNDGTLFKINPSTAEFQTIHEFNAFGKDGLHPHGGLLDGNDGFLYGTTAKGGTHSFGTIYKINQSNRAYQVLHNFSFRAGDGALPLAGLAEGPDGFLYGVTSIGGSNRFGTVFKINKDGNSYQVLHHFPAFYPGDGMRPWTSLYADSNGVLFGTTAFGGNNGNVGTVFRLNSDGSNYQLIHSFSPLDVSDYNNSIRPTRLTEGIDGKIYGLSEYGGPIRAGHVFRFDKDGQNFETLTNLADLAEHDSQGPRNPQDGFVQTQDGTLYSAARFLISLHPSNGVVNVHENVIPEYSDPIILTNDSFLGTVRRNIPTPPLAYKVNTDGTGYRELYKFTPFNEPSSLAWPLLLARDGNLYSTTTYLPTWGPGQIYQLSPEVPPLKFTAITLTQAGPQLLISGPAHAQITLEQSSTLQPNSWEPLGSVIELNDLGLAEIQPPTPSENHPIFYRATLQQ